MDAESLAAHIAFTTSGSLVDCVDKKVIAVLRDGRKYIGVLRSYDQFANLVLQDTVERVDALGQYTELDRGVCIVRGENVVLLGEIDLEAETYLEQQQEQQQQQQQRDSNSNPNSNSNSNFNSSLPFKVSDPNLTLKILADQSTQSKIKSDREKRKEIILRREKGFCEEGVEGDGY